MGVVPVDVSKEKCSKCGKTYLGKVYCFRAKAPVCRNCCVAANNNTLGKCPFWLLCWD